MTQSKFLIEAFSFSFWNASRFKVFHFANAQSDKRLESQFHDVTWGLGDEGVYIDVIIEVQDEPRSNFQRLA